jgi:hypothetical protein
MTTRGTTAASGTTCAPVATSPTCAPRAHVVARRQRCRDSCPAAKRTPDPHARLTTERLSAEGHVRDTLDVAERLESASGFSRSLMKAIAASRSATSTTARIGPKISSCMTGDAGSTSVSTVRCDEQVIAVVLASHRHVSLHLPAHAIRHAEMRRRRAAPPRCGRSRKRPREAGPPASRGRGARTRDLA